MTDTIYALSSAPGRAGVAVVRVSGPMALDIGVALSGVPPEPRLAVVRELVDEDRRPIDQAMVLWMPGPRSFTGEDVAEFHIHGGRAILNALLAEIGKTRDTRPAEPGEFTRRAVENGKLDLTQAEAVMDLVNADTEAQRRQALRQYGGALGQLYEGWRDRLVKALAWAEAEIDFSDDDLPGELIQRSQLEVIDIIDEIDGHLKDARRGEIIREGARIAVVGPPNAGKSSLINALAKRDVAIVHETAGTTRDVIEVALDIGGMPVLVSDTAGLRETADPVEQEGVRRALLRADQADIVLLLLDGSMADPYAGMPADADEQADLVVFNKSDLAREPARDGLSISLKTGDGVSNLLNKLQQMVSVWLEIGREAPVLTRARHRHALVEAVASLRRSLSASGPELFTEDMRLAVRAIGRITGRVDVEELLDVVFRDFCIGK